MSRTIHLKVKIKSLAAEATIIRLEEQKARSHRRWCAANDSDNYQKANEAFWSLRHHRTGIVSDEARNSLLAYGFLRGIPYAVMESKTRCPPDFDAVKRIAARFSDGLDENSWKLWLLAASNHIKSVRLAA